MSKKVNFVPYPEIDDPDFYQTLYSKKEFFKTKSPPDGHQTMAEACSARKFTIQKYQEFVRNFISSSTNYNGLLMFWGVGVGKCLLPDSLVYVNGHLMPIGEIWSRFHGDDLQPEEDHGEWSVPTQTLYINTYDHLMGSLIEFPVHRLYRQPIHEKITVVKLKNGSTVKLTQQHHLLTEKGWTNDWKHVKKVAIPRLLINQKNMSPIGHDCAQFLGCHMAVGYERPDNTLLLTNLSYQDCLGVIENNAHLCEQYQIYKSINKCCLKVISSDYVELLQSYGYQWGLEPKDKVFPTLLLKASLEDIRAFLRTYCDLQAFVNRRCKRLEFPPISTASMSQLRVLFKYFGIELRVKQTGSYSSGILEGHQMVNFNDEIGLISHTKIDQLEAMLTGSFSGRGNGGDCGSSHTTHKDILMCEIESVGEEEYEGYVYDLEVDLYHNYVANGILCHNTCGAIQIAEGLKDTVQKMGKKIFIISPRQIKPNFIKELYNKDREDMEKRDKSIPGSRQCAGDTYDVPTAVEADPEKRMRRIVKRIEENYTFKTPYEFTKFAFEMCAKTGSFEYFSDCVFIIDEAHGLTKFEETERNKTEQDTPVVPATTGTKVIKRKKIELKCKITEGTEVKYKELKEMKIYNIFRNIFKQTHGTKLLLLTATPMRDTADDVVLLLDLLRMNDKKLPLIESIDADSPRNYKQRLFPTKNTVDENLLLKLSRGYISFARGENPTTFPAVVDVGSEFLANSRVKEPKIYFPKPIWDEHGQPLTAESWMKRIKLIRCPMSYYQFASYVAIMSQKTKAEGVPDVKGLQACDIIFPVSGIPLGKHGSEGFNAAIERTTTKVTRVRLARTTTTQLKPKNKSQYHYRDPKSNFLSLSEIGKYSKKFEILLENIINSKGIIFVFSNYIVAGVRPIALMLEVNGYKRYTGVGAKSHGESELWSQPVEHQFLRCAKCGKQQRAHGAGDHKFAQGTYVLFTGGDDGHVSQAEIDIINQAQNMDGELIKIILGTRAAAEGLDYKRVRQVHIIEPWFNNTKIYQVIGRASRYCSHVDLPDEEKKVTVFKYCSAPPDLYDQYVTRNGQLKAGVDPTVNVPGPAEIPPFTIGQLLTETTDEKVYRSVEDKDLLVKRVERVLKKAAVDCAVNYNINHFASDVDGSRECDYQQCDYHCENNVDVLRDDQIVVNSDTYNMYFSEPQIIRAQSYIIELFRDSYAISLKNLIKLIQKNYPEMETIFIYEAIDRILSHNLTVTDQYGRSGHLIFADPYYVFQPDDLHDPRAPLYYHTTPLTIKKSAIHIDQLGTQMQARKRHESSAAVAAAAAAAVAAVTSVPQANIDKILTQLKTLAKSRDLLAKYRVHYKLDRLPPEIQARIFETVKSVGQPAGQPAGQPTGQPAGQPTGQPVGQLTARLTRWVSDFFIKYNLLYLTPEQITRLPQIPDYETIVGHHIAGIDRIRVDQKWNTATDRGFEVALDALNTMKRQEEAVRASQASDPRKPATLVGFIAKEKGTINFKVLNYLAEKQKETHVKTGEAPKISRKSCLTGKVCRTFNLDKELLEFADRVGATGHKGLGKEDICEILELYCRQRDDRTRDQPDPQRWFFYPDDVYRYVQSKNAKPEGAKRGRKKKVDDA